MRADTTIRWPRLRWAGALLVTAGGAACGGEETQDPAPEVPEKITVTSTAFKAGQPIPEEYTCDGADTSPPLDWTGVPADAQALALVVDDPDAPDGTFTHWVVLDIPAGVQAVDTDGVPEGGTQADNSTGEAAYMGPCPPSGTHHYRFTIYALSEPTGLSEGAGPDQALDAIGEQAVAQGTLEGTYSSPE